MLSTGTVVLTTAKAASPPTLIGSASGQYLLVVQNRGPLRVFVGTRDDLQQPGSGTVLGALDSYTHPGADALYVMLEPSLASVVPVVAVTLQFQQYLRDAPGAASIAGPVFPWPTAPDYDPTQP